ncbi:MAG: hypothetical protein JXQ93_13615 [Flavobacteriaceae bacterium]
MKRKALVLLIISISLQNINAQFKVEQLIGTWESYETEAQRKEREQNRPITESIGSNEKSNAIEIILKFHQKNKMDLTQGGIPYKVKYKLKDSLLIMGNRKYIISKLSKDILILKDYNSLFSTETNYRRSKKKIKIINEFEEVIEKFPNGKLKYKGMRHNGFDHGKHTEWYENGQKKSEKYFIDGIPTGTWKEWNKDGKLLKEKKWN